MVRVKTKQMEHLAAMDVVKTVFVGYVKKQMMNVMQIIHVKKNVQNVR